MSYSYNRLETQRHPSTRRSALGYWIPLAVTVTVATVGLATWIWSERRDDESEDIDRRRDASPPRGSMPDLGTQRSSQMRQAGVETGTHGEEEGVFTRMSRGLRRTPSPQNIFDGVVAGVAAAGAAVGGVLSTIQEEDKRDFEDHSRWSEEAKSRDIPTSTREKPGPGVQTIVPSSSTTAGPLTQSGGKSGGKRKTVAIVISAHADYHNPEDASHQEEHASILSHLPHHVDATSRVFVLIYAPDLRQHPLDTSAQAVRPTPSITSSYSNIGHEEAQSRGEDNERPLSLIDPDPMPAPSQSKMFQRLYTQAQTLVDNDTMIMPFTSDTGHVPLLRHLAPEIVYLQESLSGQRGDVITNISNWVGQVVLVVGDESGHGGLVDSEDERGQLGEHARERWWQDDPRIGLGKGVEVVEGLRVGEDWRRRVGGQD